MKPEIIVDTSDTIDETRRLEFMSTRESYPMVEPYLKLQPSDSFYLNEKDEINLNSLWRDENFKGLQAIPADLLFSGTLPITDCDFRLTVESMSRVVEGRVCIHPDYKQLIENGKDEKAVIIGLIMLGLAGGVVGAPLAVTQGFNCIGVNEDLINFNLPESGERSLSNVSVMDWIVFSCRMLGLWYGIQISLLHPVIKDVFANTRSTRLRETVGQGKHKRRITRYVKKHYLNSDELDTAINGKPEGRSFVRHTLAWYVIGHWRHYANGNKVFIQGYWKGALREMKRNMDSGRDRELVLSEQEA